MKTIIAAFTESVIAHQAIPDLASLGIDSKDVTIIEPGANGRMLVDKLRDAGVPDDQAGVYAEMSRRGGAVVIVKAEDALATDVDNVLDGRGSIDLEGAAKRWRAAGWSGLGGGRKMEPEPRRTR